MAMKPGYKQTEVGVIPEEWEVLTAAAACELVVDCKNRTPPVVADGEFAVARTPNVRAGKFVREDLRFTDEVSFREWTARAVPKVGDILITREAPLGEVCLVPDDLKVCLGQRMMLFRPDTTRTESAFLLYALTSTAVQSNLQRMIGGSTVGHAKVDDIRFLEFPLPALPEQRVIAGALSDVDALIGALDQLIVKKRDLKQAAMQQLLTGQKRLPGFHGEWEVKRLGEIGRCFAGGTPSTARSDYWGGDVYWLPSGRVQNNILEEPTDAEITITHLGLEESAATKIRAYSVLVAITGATCANVAMLRFEAAANQSVVAIEPFPGTDYRFLYYALLMERYQILSLQNGSAQGGVNLKTVKGLEVHWPLLPEQTAIAEVLSDMDAELAALEGRGDKTRALKQGMMQELLTGRIRLSISTSSKETPQQAGPAQSENTRHNWAFNEAVVIAALANKFGSREYPLGRLRYTKLAYLMHRHVEGNTEGYLKKAAGPYNPATRYKGPEGIAQKNGYVRAGRSRTLSGFVSGENINQALVYFRKWYGSEALEWLDQFRYEKNEALELLATVDMAILELRAAGKKSTVENIKEVLRVDPEWKPKLRREVFSDANIKQAIAKCQDLFALDFQTH
jgi:type I restriction enzyme S subunit